VRALEPAVAWLRSSFRRHGKALLAHARTGGFSPPLFYLLAFSPAWTAGDHMVLIW